MLSHAEIPSDEQLADYYRQHYRAEYHGEFLPAPHRVVREWKRGAYLARLLAPHLKPRDRIFEIGCGMGCTVKQLELAGYDATGVEPGDGFRRFATQHLRARVERGVLADIHRPAHYDAALLVHVLEHLPSPTMALRQIHALLGERGRLYVEVPDAGAPTRIRIGCSTSRTSTTSRPAHWRCWPGSVAFKCWIGFRCLPTEICASS